MYLPDLSMLCTLDYYYTAIRVTHVNLKKAQDFLIPFVCSIVKLLATIYLGVKCATM